MLGKIQALHLGPVCIDLPLVLSPMASVTNAPFRALCQDYARAGLQAGIGNVEANIRSTRQVEGLYVNEMITARALVEGSRRSLAMLASHPREAVRSVQLYGTGRESLEKATRTVIQAQVADHIDLNFGCPVPKVTRKGGGSALPWKIEFYSDIVRTVVKAAQGVPVSVKIRTGIDPSHLTFLEAGQRAQEAGAAAVTLHGRTTSQYYGGKANWDAIATLVEHLDIPVIGNGDVFSGADALALLEHTKATGVAIGRGAQGRPWLFAEIAYALATGIAPIDDETNRFHANVSASLREIIAPTSGQICTVIATHAAGLIDFYGDETHALHDLRKHLGWYLRGFPINGQMRSQLARVDTSSQLHALLGSLDPYLPYPVAARGRHGRGGAATRVHLPYGWLENQEIDAAARAVLYHSELEDAIHHSAGG